MPKIQVDVPDELMERARHAFEMRVGSKKIPVANRHLVQWCVEQYVRGIPETIERSSEEILETRGTYEETPHKPIPALEDVLEEIDKLKD